MLDYDLEAARYDESRGGEPRADAAADAIRSLLPAGARTLLDIACGTGIVTARLARPGLAVFGADLSLGMARYARTRLAVIPGPVDALDRSPAPGRVMIADGRALPIATASLDIVTAIWLLHLVDGVSTVVAEAARVLRPGGMLISTVDKDAAHNVGSDIDDLLRTYRNRTASDAHDTVCGYGRDHDLEPHAKGSFIGHGQGRSPAAAAREVRRGHFVSAARFDARAAEAVADRLEHLPDPELPRPDPVYRLIALRKRRR